MWKCAGHALYDDFPSGKVIEKEELGIDFKSRIIVVASAVDRWPRWHKGKGKWYIAEYVAVQFQAKNRFVWTNFSRDGEQWLWTSREMRIHYGEDPDPPPSCRKRF